MADGGTIEAGWLVAPLDLRRGDQRSDQQDRSGSVAGLLVAPEAEALLVAVESVVAIAGRGLQGDRYAAGRGRSAGRVAATS